MIRTLEAFLQAEWTNFFPDEQVPRRVRIGVLSSSREADGTRVLLAFRDRRTTPSLVVKTPRHPERVDALEREWRQLRRVGSYLPRPMRDTVPRALCTASVSGLPVFVQTAAPGRSLKTLIQRGQRPISPRGISRDLQRMEGWLTGLQSASARAFEADTPEPWPDTPEPWPDTPEPWPAESHTANYSAQASILRSGLELTASQVASLEACASTLDSIRWAGQRCWVHGDLWPGNVLEAGKRWSVIDWDGLSVGGPWEDRLSFAIQLGTVCFGRILGHANLEEALRRTLFEPHPVTKAIRSHLRDVSRRLVATGISGAPGRGDGRIRDTAASRVYRDALLLMLARDAARALSGTTRSTLFVSMAPELLVRVLRGEKKLAL